MADEKHLAILKKGVDTWNKWRKKNPNIAPDLIFADLGRENLCGANLSGADLVKASLSGADLSGTNLSGANLRGADLNGTDLSGANLGYVDLRQANLSEANLLEADLVQVNLSGANLVQANLSGADLSGADLSGADLGGADLAFANLSRANLRETNLRDAELCETLFIDVGLSQTQGLASLRYWGPSTIDHRTLQQSGPLPLTFLRGCGLPDNLIDYLPSLLNQPIQHYSCFISYSTKDNKFVRRLHADLQDRGVRCWLAPEDMKWGAKQWDAIDEAIRLRDKVLLVLSKDSIESSWVEDEVNKAFAEERKREKTVLFPVRIDDAVMETEKPWATKLRDDRNIGDFRNWTDPDAYEKSLERALKDLTVEKKDKARRLR